jgi:hypothetical protein
VRALLGPMLAVCGYAMRVMFGVEFSFGTNSY